MTIFDRQTTIFPDSGVPSGHTHLLLVLAINKVISVVITVYNKFMCTKNPEVDKNKGIKPAGCFKIVIYVVVNDANP